MNKFNLTVVIPCYNEKENLEKGVLKEVHDYLKNKKFSWEVLISDDGSTDNSKKLVEEKIKNLSGFRQLKNPHGGKPSALWYGIKAAQGEHILFTDMDQSTPIRELDKLLPHLQSHEVVIGSRGMQRKNFPIYRKLGSIVFITIRRTFILPEITDTQCGFKLFSKQSLERSFPKLQFFRNKEEVKGWKVTSYDAELLYILKKLGYKIKEVTVIWNDRDESTKKGGALSKYIKESKEMVTQILRVKLNDLRGYY